MEGMQRMNGPAHTRTLPRILFVLLSCLVGLACASGKDAIKVMPVDPRYADMDTMKAVDSFIQAQEIDKTNSYWKQSLPRPPRLPFDPTMDYFWILKTNVGTLKIKLLTETAPMHVSSTIYLTRLEFYDGLTFHRVIPKFMAQGGDPLGDGTGGPGYHIADELEGKERHKDEGVVSAANHGPRTDGSQFFITFATQGELDGKHTIFGKVVEGNGTVKGMEVRGTKEGKPQEKIYIKQALIWIEPKAAEESE